MENNESFNILLSRVWIFITTLKNSHYPVTLNVCIPYDTEVLLVGAYPVVICANIHQKLYKKIHISIICNSPKFEKPKYSSIMG